MRKVYCFLIVSLIIVLAGCEQAQKNQSANASRKDRLIANENIGLRNEIGQYKSEIEKQKKLVQDCQEEKAKSEEQAGENIKWLLDDLPADLLKQIEALTAENEQLKTEIEKLKGSSVSAPNEPAVVSPNVPK